MIAWICALAPVQNSNRPLEDIERRVYGHRARLVACTEYLMMVALAVIGMRSIVTVVLCVLFATCLTACAGAARNRLNSTS